MTVLSGTWVGMVVIVPAFAVGEKRKEPIVLTVFACFIVAVTPNMSR